MTQRLRDRADAPDAPLLRALGLGLRGDWASTHEIAQAEDGPDAAWVHAWLHRIEGDTPNAAYWYRRSGRAAPTPKARPSRGRSPRAERRAAGSSHAHL